ncbi:DUF4129 domain-containing protein [Chloroflexota bacterium]
MLNLNWTAVVFFPLTVLLIEVFWLYPWLAWSGQVFAWQRPPLSLASLLFLMSISFIATKFSFSRRWPMPLVQSGMVSCGLAATFIVVRVEYGAGFELVDGEWFVHTGRIILNSFSQPHPMMLALVVVPYLWWRGLRLEISPLYSNDVYRSFIVGFIALVILIIVWGVSLGTGSLQGLASTIGLHIAGFFLFSLMAMAIRHLLTIRQKILEKEVITQVPGKRWWYLILGVPGSIVLVGIGVTSIFSTEFVVLLEHLWDLTYELLLQVMHYMLIPIGYIAQGLAYVVQFIINLLVDWKLLNLPGQSGSAGPGEIERLPEGLTPYVLPEWVPVAIKWGVFAIVAGIAIFLLIKLTRHYQSFRAKAGVEEISESLWSWQGFKADLGLFFRMIWQRLEHKRRGLMLATPAPRWYAEDDALNLLSIREVYRHLLWKASCSGIVRRSHETPYEYARRLGQAMPDGSRQVGEITELYIDVRYGNIEAEDKQIDYANNLWKALRSLLPKPTRDW